MSEPTKEQINKRLTEVAGQCWHDLPSCVQDHIHGYVCCKCGEWIYPKPNAPIITDYTTNLEACMELAKHLNCEALDMDWEQNSLELVYKYKSYTTNATQLDAATLSRLLYQILEVE
jgi:hypothetical protein